MLDAEHSSGAPTGSQPLRGLRTAFSGPGVPINFVYLPDEVLHLAEREESRRSSSEDSRIAPNSSLILEDPDRLQLAYNLQRPEAGEKYLR